MKIQNGEVLRRQNFNIFCDETNSDSDKKNLTVYNPWLTVRNKDVNYNYVESERKPHGKRDNFEVFGDIAFRLSSEERTFDQSKEACDKMKAKLFQIKTKEDLTSYIQYSESSNINDWSFVDIAIEEQIEVSGLVFPISSGPYVVRTKSPFAVKPVSNTTNYRYLCSFYQQIADEDVAVDASGMKYYMGDVSYKNSDLLDQAFVDGLFSEFDTGGAKPKLFEPLYLEELNFVYEQFFETQDNSVDVSYVFLETTFQNGTKLGLSDRGVHRAIGDEYGRPIFQVNLDPGVKEVNIATKLKFESFDPSQTSSFCGTSLTVQKSKVSDSILKRVTRSAGGSCSPDDTQAKNLLDDIKNKTRSMFPDKDPIINLNGWGSGSIICDYEIKFLEPLRFSKAKNDQSEQKASLMQNFLAEAATKFAEYQNNADFTESSTSEAERIICDAEGTFACDYRQQLNDTWTRAIERSGGCLPDSWRCDGFVQCPTASDEIGCSSLNAPAIHISRKQIKKLYLTHTYSSHQNYPKNYRALENWEQTYETGTDMIFSLHFLELQLERGDSKCLDWIEIEYEQDSSTNFTERLCGDSNNLVFVEHNGQLSPHSLPKTHYVVQNKLTIRFRANGINQRKGHLIRIESIPKAYKVFTGIFELEPSD